MTAVAHSLTPPAPPAVPQPKRWSADEFHRVRSQPWLEGRSLILVAGVILEMPSPNPAHDASLGLTEQALRQAFGARYWVRGQMALVLGQTTDPVPDIAVVPGGPRDFASHPHSAELVVEIAESSVNYDLRDKASLYAAGGIQEYWVIDLTRRRLVMHRDPAADAAQAFGAAYATVREFGAADAVQPLAAGAARIPVGDLLP